MIRLMGCELPLPQLPFGEDASGEVRASPVVESGRRKIILFLGRFKTLGTEPDIGLV